MTPQVLIQPSFGNKVAQAHWRDTLDQAVSFIGEDREALLSTGERAELLRFHPDGRARFWGATQNQNHIMASLKTGDVVLFTGLRHVRGIGEVGVSFRNEPFSETLWEPGERGPWLNVYSLRSFVTTAIPYPDLRAPLGSDEGDNFMGLRLLRDGDDRIPAVLDAMGVSTDTAQEAEMQELARTANEVAKQLDQLVPPEAVNVGTGRYERAARQILITRTESLLVSAYRQSLPDQFQVQRIRCGAGICDLYVSGHADGPDLIEAKARATHPYVRQALGQLLDYVHASNEPVSSLAALFPEAPTDADIAMLHRYGIDVVYRREGGSFHRVTTEPHRRGLWQRADR